jgi:hypothetical protein
MCRLRRSPSFDVPRELSLSWTETVYFAETVAWLSPRQWQRNWLQESNLLTSVEWAQVDTACDAF